MDLVSIDVHLNLNPDSPSDDFVVVCTPNEAFALLSMPALAGVISKLVPNYEASQDESFKLDDFREALSEMPKE